MADARNTRTRAKDQRRARILDAARALVREGGVAALSMRTLADRASVSLATPYALIGSRDDILMRLLDQDFENFSAAFAAQASPDALVRIFDLPRIAGQFYRRETAYHRGVLSEVYSLNGAVREEFTAVREAFWRDLIVQAQSARLLMKAVEPELFRLLIESIYMSALSSWAWGSLELEEFVLHVDYGFAAAMRGVATARASGPLQQRLLTAQVELAAIRARQKLSEPKKS